MVMRRLSGRFSKPSSPSFAEDETPAADEEEASTENESFSPPTTTNGVRAWRRSFPQTPQEAQFRLGILQPPRDNDNYFFQDKKPTATATTTTIHRNQLIPWEHLNQNAVLALASTRSSVWNGGSGLFDIEENDFELDKICQLFSVHRSTTASTTGTRVVKETVLDHKRATQVSVAMKRLNLSPTKLGKLAWALRDMNESYLTPAAVEIMYKSKLWPSAKEVDMLKKRQNEVMQECDAFLWFVHTSVPDLEQRIQAMNFRYEFEEQRQEMVRATGLVKAASSEVCGSELLKRTLRVTLLVGNYINETFGAPAAWGIHVSSLSKLSTIRTTDKSLSVLDCVIEYIDLAAPECLEVADECTCTPMAAQYSLQAEHAKLQQCRKTLETLVKRYKPMDQFYLSASRALDLLEREFTLAELAFQRCLEHFCLPAGSRMDSKEFFQLLQEFFTQVDKSIQALEQRQRTNQLNHQASQLFRGQSGLMNPGWMQQRKKSVSEDKPVKLGRMSVFGRMRPVTKS